MRAHRLEQNRFDEQQALLLLSGFSPTRRQALLSGTSLIRTQFSCLAAVFPSGIASGVQRARSVPSGFALLHILVPNGLILSCSRFVGRTPTESKPKIQGFTLTDEWSAASAYPPRDMKKFLPGDDICSYCSSTRDSAIALIFATRDSGQRSHSGRSHRRVRRRHYDGRRIQCTESRCYSADRRHCGAGRDRKIRPKNDPLLQ